MCYYNSKSFEFSSGLNIILGHNGDGKSTIFTAFNWLFDQYSSLELSQLYSKKKFSEQIEGETFEVKIEFVISQFSDQYNISKSFIVSKLSGAPKFSIIKEEIWKKNIDTNLLTKDTRSISRLTQQIFPEAFRNFSMFETETDALRIVEGQKLAELVKSFSNAKYYEKLASVIEEISGRAYRQFRRESNADQAATETIDKLDKKILDINTSIKKISQDIVKDEKGKEFYTNRINNLVQNLTISDDFKKIDENTNLINIEIYKLKKENNDRNKFTEKMFDDFYFLIGFDNIIAEFSEKINDLRINKNKIDNEERNKYAVEQLKLENGSTPFPPGFPSMEILKEILEDNICKICNTPLEINSKNFINKSISLYLESKSKEKTLPAPIIFPNNYIDEFQIIYRSIQLNTDIFSEYRIKEEIKFSIERIEKNNQKILENQKRLSDLQTEKKELLSKIPNISEDDLKNIRINHEQYSREKDQLITQIAQNQYKLENLKSELIECQKTKTKTLSQFKDSSFKKHTVEYLNVLSETAKIVMEDEYKSFLKILSERATNYLKQINVGEITGKISLYKKNEKEVAYKSLNEDGNIRSLLEDSGALQISKPLSILFAIADIASEANDQDHYPMIFDAPTGRFSPDREQEFFKVLKATQKQRIVVTLRFLKVDNNNIPYVDVDSFQNIQKDKAFFIKRVRPFDENRNDTINTEIELIS